MPDQQPLLSPEPEPPGTEDLQFQHAEFEKTKPAGVCAACSKEIQDCYYHVAGAVTCPACAERRRALQGKPRGGAVFWKAALYGTGAGIAGSILYALVSLSGFRFAVIAIVVGIMVGKAIRYVTQGRSSRRYQVLAVVLTYGAICVSSLPGLISAGREMAKKHPAAAASARPNAQPPQVGRAVAGLALGLAILIGLCLALPFLYLKYSLLSGLINLLIIGIGLRQAWRITAPDELPILGPYAVENGSA
jgi:hypothetical protein